jgi:hypothetical protein
LVDGASTERHNTAALRESRNGPFPAETEVPIMRICTLLRYLGGDRQAILEIAADRRAVGYGFLFVLSAGFAREYDGHDLRHETWYLALPVAASLLVSFLLFTVFYAVARAKKTAGPPFGIGYLSFLGLFWLIAPMAWLYAIPFERFLSAADATRANLAMLGLVATWRVLLISRVLSVLWRHSFWGALCIVMVLADTMALIGIANSPLEILRVMGGIQFTDSQRVLYVTGLNLFCLGSCSLPFWFLGAVAWVARCMPAWQAFPLGPQHHVQAQRGGLLYLALASLGIWAVLLPFPQSEQQLRYQVEKKMRAGCIDTALEIMSKHSTDDFLPHWDPPPQLGFQESELSMVQIFEGMVRKEPAAWVRQVYFEKLRAFLSDESYGPDAEDTRTVLDLMKKLPEGPETVERWKKDEGLNLHDKKKNALEENKQPMKEERKDSEAPNPDE